MAIDPQTQAFNQQVEQLLDEGPAWHEMTAQELRDYLLTSPLMPPPEEVPQAQERSIPGPGGDIPLRVFVPETVNGAFMHIHGGGWTVGSHDAQDVRLWERAQAMGAAIVSVGYRLAPEHPYPAAQDDCEAVALWLTKNARSEFGSDRLVIGGESAGGHLAATTLLRMRDKHNYTGFRGAALTYGVFDLRHSPSARRFGDRRLVINTPIMKWFVDKYITPEQADDPDVTPLLADVSNLPPAMFTVGTLDPLLDDTLFMEARWRAAGNETDLRIYEGGVHGFDAFPIGIGFEATAAMNNFLGRCLAR